MQQSIMHNHPHNYDNPRPGPLARQPRPILGIIVINPTLESITEAKVTSQNYDAEFGPWQRPAIGSFGNAGRNPFL